MKKVFLFLMILFSLKCVSQNHWVPNYHQFPTNMCVIAVLEINGIEQTTELLELGVFTGDECRGSCMLHHYAPPVDRYLLFLTTYGNNGDPYTFKLYDHLTQLELDFPSSNEMSFYSNDVIGSVSNPYVFSFTGGNCTVNTVMDPPGLGEVTGGGDYLCGTYCTVTASPFGEHTFAGWMHGEDTLTTEASFSFNAVADIDFKACFVEYIPEFTVSVSASPEDGGQVSGGGVYEQGMTCEVVANPSNGYQFEYWSEEGVPVSEDLSYSFEVMSDRNLVAVFSEIVVPNYYLIEVEIDPAEGGTAIGTGIYEEGALCVLSVMLNEYYEFEKWTEDGEEISEENEYAFVVNADRSLVAHVKYINAVTETAEAILLYPNPTQGLLCLSDAVTDSEDAVEVVVYDGTGRKLLSSKERILDLSSFDDGVYYIRIGEGTVRKVVLSH